MVLYPMIDVFVTGGNLGLPLAKTSVGVVRAQSKRFHFLRSTRIRPSPCQLLSSSKKIIMDSEAW